MQPKEWVVFAAVPPQLPTQPKITALLGVEGRVEKAKRVLEACYADPALSEELRAVARRPLLALRIPYEGQQSLKGSVTYPKVEAYSEFLNSVESDERVEMPEVYLQQYLLPASGMNFRDPVLARWIYENINLPTGRSTTSYERTLRLMERLIELFHGRVVEQASPDRTLAEAVASGGVTGAEISELAVAVLRSYGDPARLRVQRYWKQTGGIPEYSGRTVMMQFFYNRVGWINCMPGAAAEDGGIGSNGVFGQLLSSRGVTYHLDTDLRLPVTDEVVRVKRWLINPAAYLVDEDGVVLDCGVVCQRLAETLHKPPR